MFKKTITYTDYNGQELKQEFLFNLTKAEIMEMQLSEKGGFAEKIQLLVDTKDVPEIIKVFKDLIIKSYGIKSPDGARFIKSKELSDAFMQTEAFSELFMELATNPETGEAFVKGVIPTEQLKALQEKK